MRLTKKDKIKELLTYQKHKVLMVDNEYKELKLGQLEDIEDELGIDLVIFVKMIKYGGYIKTAFGIEKFNTRNGDIDFKGKMFYVATKHTLRTLLFKDYGRTWALTKEELL